MTSEEILNLILIYFVVTAVCKVIQAIFQQKQ